VRRSVKLILSSNRKSSSKSLQAKRDLQYARNAKPTHQPCFTKTIQSADSACSRISSTSAD
jgi:hypothetical protein